MQLLIYNPAGGSGKTTLARNLAHELGHQGLGLNVLALDFDANSQLSRMCGKFTEFHQGQPFELADLAEGNNVPLHRSFGIQLLPGGPKSVLLQLSLHSRGYRETTLTAHLEPLVAAADITIIDVAPGYGAMTLCAVNFATHLLIPFDLSATSFLNAAQVLNRFRKLPLKQIGFVPMQTRGDGSTARKILAQAKTVLEVQGPVLPTVQFRQSILVAEHDYLPLRISMPECVNVQVFRAIAEHVRLELQSSTQEPRGLPLSSRSLVPFTP